ncbi:MAG TPA: hypothetical protein VKR22_06930, partial [Acidimicrobiales bacterium]|nr:hypothetical protein [Acidimicrobiales bacterium]
MSKLIWLVPAFPLLGVLINGLLVTRSREASKRYSGIIATLCVAASFVVACVLALNFHAILNGRDWVDSIAYDWITAGPATSGALNVPMALRLDGLSLTMMLVVTGVGSLI